MIIIVRTTASARKRKHGFAQIRPDGRGHAQSERRADSLLKIAYFGRRYYQDEGD